MPDSSGQRNKPALPLLLLVSFFALAYILFPLWSIVKESIAGSAGRFTFESYRSLLRPSLLEATFNSVAISILSVIGSAVVGTFLAYVFQYIDFPAKSIFARVLLIPLALPPLVGVISFLFLIGESGMLSKVLSILSGISPSFFALSGWTGIIIVHVYSFYVYFYLFVSSALSQLDGNVLDASVALGASRMRTIGKVLLPMLTPSLVGASLITFMASMASFSAPLLFGGTTRFLTLEIYTAKLNGDDSTAAALAILLSIVSVYVLLFLRWWQANKSLLGDTKGVGRASVIRHGRTARFILVFTTLFIAFLFALPIITIIMLSFVREGTWTYQIFPSSFTLSNYSQMFSDTNLLLPFTNSIRMALTATLVVLIVGVAAAYAIAKKKFRGRRVLEAVLSLPFGIPGTVIAVGLILSFDRPTIFSFGSVLIGTFWIMPIAYAVRNLPLLYRSTTAGLESLSPSLLEAASILGSSGTMTFRKIVLPLIAPSIISGALLVFINSAGEFVSSILLYSYDTKPISVEILSQLRLFNIGGAAVYSTLLMILVFSVVILSQKAFKTSISV
ncbi:MAG TPA: iron ABC transporter permease [Bacteroidota bacterium]|nr:iron ABC transporter permease [Bacteroidota bacterium]